MIKQGATLLNHCRRHLPEHSCVYPFAISIRLQGPAGLTAAVLVGRPPPLQGRHCQLCSTVWSAIKSHQDLSVALLLNRTKRQNIRHYWMPNNNPSECHPKRPKSPGRLPASDFIVIVFHTLYSFIRQNMRGGVLISFFSFIQVLSFRSTTKST